MISKKGIYTADLRIPVVQQPLLFHGAYRPQNGPKIQETENCLVNQGLIPDSPFPAAYKIPKPDIGCLITAVAGTQFLILPLIISQLKLKTQGKCCFPVIFVCLGKPVKHLLDDREMKSAHRNRISFFPPGFLRLKQGIFLI